METGDGDWPDGRKLDLLREQAALYFDMDSFAVIYSRFPIGTQNIPHSRRQSIGFRITDHGLLNLLAG